MYIITNNLNDIKSHHTYNHRLKTSTWTGLNKADKVPGGDLDKLRNNLSNTDWATLYVTVEENLSRLPAKQHDEWERALVRLLGVTDLRFNPLTAITVDGEFSNYILNKCRDYKVLQKALWAILMSGMECLEYINWDTPTNPDSLWETE
jgi:hypothetical protein